MDTTGGRSLVSLILALIVPRLTSPALERLWYLASDETEGHTLEDGSLADPGRTQEDRVVLQNIHSVQLYPYVPQRASSTETPHLRERYSPSSALTGSG